MQVAGMVSDEQLLALTFADLREFDENVRLRIYAEIVGAWTRSSRLNGIAKRPLKREHTISSPTVDAFDEIQQFSRIRATRR